MRQTLCLAVVVAALHACPMPDPSLSGEDAGARDGGLADAGSLFVGRPQNPCTDIEAWRTVSLAPNGTLTAANVSEVLRAVSRPGTPLNNVVGTIVQADRSRCTTGATVNCSCPDGGTVAYTTTRTVTAGVSTLLQCTIVTMCGLDGQVIDGTSAQREVSRLEQGQERKEVTEAYRYTWQGAFDLGFYAELTSNQVSFPARYGIPVADGVVVVIYDQNMPFAPVTVIDARGSWSCGSFMNATGTCQRGMSSLPWMIR